MLLETIAVMVIAGAERLPDWIVLAQETWGPVERRNQRLIRALTVRNPAARVVFVERALRPREFRDWRRPLPRQVAPGVWAVRVIRPLPDRFAKRLSDRLEVAQIRAVVRYLGLERPWLWTQDPRVWALLPRLAVAGVLYDLTDDWAAFEEDSARRATVEAQVTGFCGSADLVLACSRTLQTLGEGCGAAPVYVPNAVDQPVLDGPLPGALAAVPEPRVGYVGTLHTARLDIDLLVSLARARSDLSFVFLGPDHLESSDRERLFSLPNVHYLGVCEYAAVGAYLTGFAAALLPNRITGFTHSLDPLKTYEYLAAGLPVIASDAGIPEELRAVVSIAEGAEGFAQALTEVLANDGNDVRAARRGAVAGHTWAARAESIETALGVGGTTPPPLDVSVVVVSFNTRDLLAQCLHAVERQVGPRFETIVVDNSSSDGSVDLVRGEFASVGLIEAGANLGFARANNVAFAGCRGRYILLLNSDAFMDAGALAELVAVAERHPRAGAVGARLLNEDGTLQRSAWPFPDPLRLLIESVGLHRLLRRSSRYEDLGTWAHDSERTVDFLTGACLLVRAEALAEVGGFDEDFWLYAEEADLQQRLARRGWYTVLAPTAVVTHLGGASEMATVARMRHFYGGQFGFLAKHRGRTAAAAGRLALLIGSLLRRRWIGVAVAVLPRPRGGGR